MAERKRYVQVGLGSRAEMYLDAVAETYREHCEMVGLCDRNPGRVETALRRVEERGGGKISGVPPDEFDRLLREVRAEEVIVTAMDSAHDDYIVRALEVGCDVITEKPMTIDEKRCRRILEAVERTGRHVRVTFNYRYSPVRSQVKELLMQGVVGRILSVDFQWLLDLRHGADYFRRWHRRKENSGGLLVHKATHHFDLVNWWLSSLPETVAAFGGRNFYVPEQGDAYGLGKRGKRCTGCPESERCRFFLDIDAKPKIKRVYRDHEHHDIYYRDSCVFSPEIDIEDSMNVIVHYRSGAGMSYSLNAFMPWEGYCVTFNGTKGRLVHGCRESSYVSGDGSVQGGMLKDGTFIELQPNHTEGGESIPVRKGKGGHGGGDSILLADLFAPDHPADPLRRAADHRAGAASILVGIAAEKAIAEKRMITLDELVPELPDPEYPPMPTERLPA